MLLLKRPPSLELYDKLLQTTLQSFLAKSDNFVTCPNKACGEAFEAVASRVQRSKSGTADVDDLGKPLTEAARQHKAENRLRCSKCATIFCRSCNCVPYHLGKTCEEYTNYQGAKKCRFCEEALTAENQAVRPPGVGEDHPLALCCSEEECIGRRGQSCTKRHACGHACGGVKGEKKCLPCMEEGCGDSDQKVDDYCQICYTEAIGAAPAVQMKCGHTFHHACAVVSSLLLCARTVSRVARAHICVCVRVCYACVPCSHTDSLPLPSLSLGPNPSPLQNQIKKKWTGARITFNFLKCPLCKVMWESKLLQKEIAPMLKLKQQVEKKALERLE